jgi:Tfp pilus assembly protein PilO
MNPWTMMTDGERDKIKALLVLVVFLVVGAGYYDQGMVAETLKTNAAAIKKQEAAYLVEKATLDRMNLMIANRAKLEARVKLLDKVISKLPTNTDPSGFFQALEGILTITRMEYQSITNEKPRSADVYTELPYSIVSRARYHDFGQFLNLIEENPNRLMRVKKFVVENDDNRPSIHPVSVQVATFMFNR